MRDLEHIHVSCAIIEQGGRVLAAQRSAAMSMPLKWEFPGGKIDPGESPSECLHRELMEELGVCVTIENQLPTSTHHYPEFAITLHPFVCLIHSGDILLHEHASIRWLQSDDLGAVDWAEADLPVINSYLAYCQWITRQNSATETV